MSDENFEPNFESNFEFEPLARVPQPDALVFALSPADRRGLYAAIIAAHLIAKTESTASTSDAIEIADILIDQLEKTK